MEHLLKSVTSSRVSRAFGRLKTCVYFMLAMLAFSPLWACAEKVALYDGRGVWNPSINHTEKLLRQMGVDTVRVSAKAVLQGRLKLGDIDAVVIPGGKSWLYREDLGAQGAQEIRSFVESGGGYIGFCAGAFMATSLREGGNTTGAYGIGLLEGTAVDPQALQYPGYKSGMKTIHFKLKNFKEKYRVIYLAGPIFRYTTEEAVKKNIRINATYSDGQTAGIHFNYGKGRVYITGPHPEVEERLNLLLRFTRPDPDSEWPLVRSLFEFVLRGIEPELTSI